MKEIYFDEELFKNFLLENIGVGYLNIRVYAANEALPIKGVKIIVSKIIDNQKVIFYEGVTNDSGIIPKISLPTPINTNSDEEVPMFITYDIKAIYEDQELNYEVSLFNDISVLQNISVVPSIRLESSYYGK